MVFDLFILITDYMKMFMQVNYGINQVYIIDFLKSVRVLFMNIIV